MPCSVRDVFAGAGLVPTGLVRWDERIPESAPGVYVVSLTEEVDGVGGAQPECPISGGAVEELLRVRRELRADGMRPAQARLAATLASLWLGDETIVYVGLAGTSLQRRVGDYYRTPLGARRPHAGGWLGRITGFSRSDHQNSPPRLGRRQRARGGGVGEFRRNEP